MTHKIKVPVIWEMKGFTDIEVENVSDIEKVFNKKEHEGEGFILPMENKYVDKSFRLDLNMDELDEGLLDEVYGIGYNSEIKLKISDTHSVGDVGIKAVYDAEKKVILDTALYNFEDLNIESYVLIYKDEEIKDFTFANKTLANRFKKKTNMEIVGYLENNNVKIELYANENGFRTIIENLNCGEVFEMEHFGCEHLVNNLLNYGINYHTIMSLMEDEFDEKSFSKNRNELTKWCEKNLKKKHYDSQEPYAHFHYYWLRLENPIKKIFKKNSKLK